MKLSVYVQPGAKKTEHSGMHDGRPKIRLNAPPVDGAANDELVKFVAKTLKLPKSSVKIISGHASRLKTLEIDADEADVTAVFGE